MTFYVEDENEPTNANNDGYYRMCYCEGCGGDPYGGLYSNGGYGRGGRDGRSHGGALAVIATTVEDVAIIHMPVGLRGLYGAM